MAITFIALAQERPLIQADAKQLLTMIRHLDGLNINGTIISGDNNPLRDWHVSTFMIEDPNHNFDDAALIFTSAPGEPGDPLVMPPIMGDGMRDDVVKICQMFRVDFQCDVVTMDVLQGGLAVLFKGLSPKIEQLIDDHIRLEQKGRLM